MPRALPTVVVTTAVLIGVRTTRRAAAEHRAREAVGATIGATTLVPPAVAPGPIGARLAAWAPDRPTTPAGRVLATVWTAPNSLAGLAWGLANGGRPHLDRARGAVVVRGVGGVAGRALRGSGTAATTLGQVVVTIRRQPSTELLDHEAAHVRQYERLGPLMLVVYAVLWARHGYRDHPLERAARAMAAAAVA